MSILIVVGVVVSLVYATAFGGEILGYVDTFINQIAVLLAVVAECIVFAWIFEAEKLIDFLNSRTKTIKIGKWWLIIVKYILPIVVTVVWVGELIDTIANASSSQFIFTIIVALILIISIIILTKLPAKHPDWDDNDERV